MLFFCTARVGITPPPAARGPVTANSLFSVLYHERSYVELWASAATPSARCLPPNSLLNTSRIRLVRGLVVSAVGSFSAA